MEPNLTQRPYVEQAVTAARVALEVYRVHKTRNLNILASFEREFKRVEILGEQHERGEATLATVVYPARKLAYQIEAATDLLNDDAPAVA